MRRLVPIVHHASCKNPANILQIAGRSRSPNVERRIRHTAPFGTPAFTPLVRCSNTRAFERCTCCMKKRRAPRPRCRVRSVGNLPPIEEIHCRCLQFLLHKLLHGSISLSRYNGLLSESGEGTFVPSLHEDTLDAVREHVSIRLLFCHTASNDMQSEARHREEPDAVKWPNSHERSHTGDEHEPGRRLGQVSGECRRPEPVK